MGTFTWTSTKDLVRKIKEGIFAVNLVDPTSYTKSDAVGAKHRNDKFSSISDDTWLGAFRRAASKFNLESDLQEVESLHGKRAHRPTHLATPTRLPRESQLLPTLSKDKVSLSYFTLPIERPNPWLIHS